MEWKRILEKVMRERDFPCFLFVHPIIICISCFIGSTYGQPPPIERMTEVEILTYLPEEARLADIPVVQFGRTQETKRIKQNVLYADVDGDSEEEIILGYYTIPHEYIINGDVQKGFFRRAHVKVLDWDGRKYVEQWDSGGWGSEFRAEMGPELKSREQRLYTQNYFGVTDINNDGIQEILCTRTSFLAEGSRFEAFSWNGKTYEPIARVENKVRIDDVDNDRIKEIICDYDYKGIKLATPKVFRWNGSTYEMVREHVPVGKPGVSVRLTLFLAILAAASLIGVMLLAKKKASSRSK